MPICTRCGKESSSDARFCPQCGALLATSAPARETRKTVTVLFADVTGSTEIGEQLDPEPLRRLMLCYYEAMRVVCERHGGRVRELIGDAVMAAFGIPTVHEDDALRAVRAAAEMRDRLAELNEELERDYGVRLQARTGINTGEVVVRDPDPDGSLVLGDPVNVAARLQTSAAPGEILVGDTTHRLVENAVRAELVPPLRVKGKTEPVRAWSLREIHSGRSGIARRFETPLLGRELELAALRQAYDRAVGTCRCVLVTIFGSAGIGKTRLAQELERSVEGEATVLTGRCLSYGEGITYWPVWEIVEQAAGLPSSRASVERVRAAIGTGEHGALKEEVSWEVRLVIETLAGAQPVVLVFEDIHWAEPTLLDLIDYLAEQIVDLPVLLVCLARPELLDDRPGWGGGQLNATSILLEPISAEESTSLIDALAGERALDEKTRARVEAAAGGNPLFLEQMLAMLAQEGDTDVIAIPPAIQSLLASRLDRLEASPRSLLERASIEGEGFHLGWLVETEAQADSPTAVTAALEALERADLVRRQRSALTGEDTFCFRHALIRDAAYERLSKLDRSELHERYADWLEQAPGNRAVEAEEFVGYHLEQAYLLRAEISRADPGSDLASRAAARLASAGLRAWRRADYPAAARVLGRADSLAPEAHPDRLAFLPELGMSLSRIGEHDRAEAVLDEVLTRSRETGDARAEWNASVYRGYHSLYYDPDAVDVDSLLLRTGEAIRTLTELRDDEGLARAWWLLHELRYLRGDALGSQQAAERTIEHGVRAGNGAHELEGLWELGWALWFGPIRVADGIRRCDELLETRHARPAYEGALLTVLGPLRAMNGDIEVARDGAGRGEQLTQEAGFRAISAMAAFFRGSVELIGGNSVAAEQHLRRASDGYVTVGDRWMKAFTDLDLARSLIDQGRHEEARELVDTPTMVGARNDIATRIRWKTTRSRVVVRLGRCDEAVSLVEDAIRDVERTDFVNEHADALRAAADVFRLAGSLDRAVAATRTALPLYERKGNVLAAEQVREWLEELGP